jgi:hypothetical protein
MVDTSAPENLDGERKTVTALFADIKGSMELMEDLDPEAARAIIGAQRGPAVRIPLLHQRGIANRRSRFAIPSRARRRELGRIQPHFSRRPKGAGSVPG